MEEKKLTDEELVKDMEYCTQHSCSEECPLINIQGCMAFMLKQSLDLIHRLQSENAEQKAEIEKLHTLTDMQEVNVKKMFENNMCLRKEIERLHKAIDEEFVSLKDDFSRRVVEVK